MWRIDCRCHNDNASAGRDHQKAFDYETQGRQHSGTNHCGEAGRKIDHHAGEGIADDQGRGRRQ